MSLIEKYPALSKFVNNVIIPSELEDIDQVTCLYVQKILDMLDAIKSDETEMGFDYFIFSVSPFPGWLDPGKGGVMDASSSHLTDGDEIEALKEALETDGVDFSHIKDTSGF